MFTKAVDGRSSPDLHVFPYTGPAAIQAAAVALPLMQTTKAVGPNTPSLGSMIAETIDGRMILWLASEGDTAIGFCFTAFKNYAGKRALQLVYGRMDRQGLGSAALDHILDWAREKCEVDRLVFEGRQGLGRWVKGFGGRPKVVSINYEVELI